MVWIVDWFELSSQSTARNGVCGSLLLRQEDMVDAWASREYLELNASFVSVTGSLLITKAEDCVVSTTIKIIEQLDLHCVPQPGMGQKGPGECVRIRAC